MVENNNPVAGGGNQDLNPNENNPPTTRFHGLLGHKTEKS